MITIEQCRAARGLLGWTQDDLGKAASLSKTAINNFERGLSDPKQETLKTIEQAFLENGIEFTDQLGVRMRSDNVRILKGDNCSELLLDDIFSTLKNGGGEILISSVNERIAYARYPDKLMVHLERLRAANITERMLAEEGDTFFLQPAECYRWIPSEFFSSLSPTFVYGDKVAIKLWLGKMILIVHSKEAADAERARFEAIWVKAKIPEIKEKKT